MHLDQHGETQVDRHTLEFDHLRLLQRCDDEEDRIGTHRAGLGHLIAVDGEVLAQHREFTGCARSPQVAGPALEELFVSEY